LGTRFSLVGVIMMKMTPLEIEQQTFNKAFRGFDPVEVSTYLEMLAEEFEKLIAENAEFKDKLTELATRLESYQKMEKTLKDTLLTTQKTAEEAKRNIEKEADLIIKEAQLERGKILEEAKVRLAQINKKLSDLHISKETYLSEFKAMLSAQWHLLENIESGTELSQRPVSTKRRRPRPRGEELEKVLSNLGKTNPEQETESETQS
jgi:cell division initiation protein